MIVNTINIIYNNMILIITKFVVFIIKIVKIA